LVIIYREHGRSVAYRGDERKVSKGQKFPQAKGYLRKRTTGFGPRKDGVGFTGGRSENGHGRTRQPSRVPIAFIGHRKYRQGKGSVSEKGKI